MITKHNPAGGESHGADKSIGRSSSSIIPRPAAGDPWQVMPPLTADEYAGLKADIQANGVLVPITVDEHGVVIDGHHRQQIAAELGIPCPRVVQDFTDDERRHNFALALNLKRRHVTREQFRELIAAECERTPDASDREIGRRLGCSHHTVATVRRPVSKDTPEGGKLPTPRVTREEAEALTEEIRAGLASWDRSMRGLLRHCFSGTVSPADLAESLQSQRGKWMAETADYPPDVATFLDERFFCGWLDELSAIHALWQGWKVNDNQWSTWLETWAQARPSQHWEITRELRDVMAEMAS